MALTNAQPVVFVPNAFKRKLRFPSVAVAIMAGVLLAINLWRRSYAWSGDHSFDTSTSPIPVSHPVEQLISISRADFEATLKRQSQTLPEAMEEYRRRYGMDPPPGFDQWFTFAKNHTVLIDEFDTIYQSISPFWKFSPATLRKNIEQASRTDQHLVRCWYTNGIFRGNCDWQGKDIESIMAPIADRLPDFSFVLNTADEARVLLSDDIEEASGDVTFQDYRGQAIWEVVSASCPNEADRSPSTHPEIPTYGLPFVQDIRESKDICQHPEYASQHARLLSPASARLTRQAVPVFSPAKASMFGDIIAPPVYYFSPAGGAYYNPEVDTTWPQKPDGRLYWAGSTTGGLNHHGVWRNFQRQRFVSRTNRLDDDLRETYLVETEPGTWSPYQSSEHLALFDVKFTAYIQCQPEEQCTKQAEMYGRHEREPRRKMYQHKLHADLDGNGFSGRWYSILRSWSTPFKQTIYREWHDDRLFPWIHYVPMSMSLDEVPELVRYMSQTETGQKHARRIAEESRDWTNQALRLEDFQVYFYRLALEYARLFDENRKVGVSI